MDDLDLKLITILQTNGRASNAYMARQVGVSEGTVRRRLGRLIGDGVIRVMAVPEPLKLGLGTMALIGLQVEPDKIEGVANRIAAFSETQYVAVTTGVFDVFLWVALPSADELGSFLRNRVGAIPGVRRSETFVNLEVKKRFPGSLA
ncbi:MAG: Lrp/AsnC family transcriptional regulator [Chloroflexi bacterium]|nr:Lrp/AsnC family transcriptional regulator [Chloroflexota bacterium]